MHTGYLVPRDLNGIFQTRGSTVSLTKQLTDKFFTGNDKSDGKLILLQPIHGRFRTTAYWVTFEAVHICGSALDKEQR